MQENHQTPFVDTFVYDQLILDSQTVQQNTGQGDFDARPRSERLNIRSAEERNKRNKRVATKRKHRGKFRR